MDLLLMLLALTAATGLSWWVADLADRWTRHHAARAPLARRRHPW